MKNIVKVLLIGIIVCFVSCKERKKTKSQTSTTSSESVLLISNNNPIVDTVKTVSPFDTLNFLDLDILMSFQEKEFGYIFKNILPYNLSSEIRLVRNELFAQKGYVFKDTLLRDYFTRQKWYSPKFSSLDSIVLTLNEKALVDTLLRYEKLNANLTRKSFQQLFLNKLILGRSDTISLALWTQAIYKNQLSFSWQFGDIYYTQQKMIQQPKMSYARWDYEGAYSIELIDNPHGYYHCILNYYCGAEGCNPINFVYVLDKELNVLDFKRLEDCSNFGRVTNNKYQYSVLKDNDDEDIMEEVRKEFYEINKDGKIQ
ncbi:MAG: YARHG domain-containing protein [Bacteroidales bacterium]|nr:YARHG domain-containing protein [Bacteroidales bacterium]MCL2133004.1 YARHG domain-containing protein [Bacteroidales bacterium]